jgi:hypothetical protein
VNSPGRGNSSGGGPLQQESRGRAGRRSGAAEEGEGTRGEAAAAGPVRKVGLGNHRRERSRRRGPRAPVARKGTRGRTSWRRRPSSDLIDGRSKECNRDDDGAYTSIFFRVLGAETLVPNCIAKDQCSIQVQSCTGKT